MNERFNSAGSMAVWDEELWHEFEVRSRWGRRERTAMQRLAETGSYAGVALLLLLILAGLVWLH